MENQELTEEKIEAYLQLKMKRLFTAPSFGISGYALGLLLTTQLKVLSYFSLSALMTIFFSIIITLCCYLSGCYLGFRQVQLLPHSEASLKTLKQQKIICYGIVPFLHLIMILFMLNSIK